MIDRISGVNLNRKNMQKSSTSQPSFKGFVDGAVQVIQLCEKYPMLNVTALDVTTAIAPRAYIESKTNVYAGFEAFRRESSGLIVNCLIPSFVVLGIDKALEKPVMGKFSGLKMSSSWASEENLDLISKYYKDAKGNGRDKVSNCIRNLIQDLEGVDGDIEKGGLKKFKDFDIDKTVETLTDTVFSNKIDKKTVKKAYSHLVKNTHISENIRILGNKNFLNTNLESLTRDMPRVIKSLEEVGADEAGKFLAKSKKFINIKSLGGLGIIIPLAISMQSINRWITSKTSGKKGAPIYKDYIDSSHKEKTPEEKAALNKQKVKSVGAMIGVGLLSMMKIPTLKTFQFKGLFPSLDQARVISTATFASRMASSEDKNELREATIRDIATFSSLYFLGDYAAKAIASLIEKHNPDIKLINRLKNPKEGANALEKFWNWVKHTSLKSSDELATVKEKHVRTWCQLGNLGFSLLSLARFIPQLYNAQTNKKRQEELEKMQAAAFGSKSGATSPSTPSSSSSSDEFARNILKGGKP